MSGKNRLDLTVIGGAVPAVDETKEQLGGSTCTPWAKDIFEQLLMQSNHAAYEAEERLLVEEKGNAVAFLQGFCAGIRDFKSVSNDAGLAVPPRLFDAANRQTPWIRTTDNGSDNPSRGIDGDEVCPLGLDELRVYSAQLDELTGTAHYAMLEESIQKEINIKKNYLYVQAKTSRDLFWTHGWHKGITWVQVQIKELHFWKGVKEKEKAETLPFDD